MMILKLLGCSIISAAASFAASQAPKFNKNQKEKAPSLEDHAAYFSENRKGLSPQALQKADALRQKSMETIKNLLATKKNAANRFELLLRLGELQVERHDYLRDYETAEFTRKWDVWSKSDLKNRGKEPQTDFSGSLRELQKASESFKKLVHEFPKHPRTDAALYALGQTLARLNDANAIKYYKKLIKNYPTSPLLADTHLALGEYYFEKHNIPEAVSHYKKAANFPSHRAHLYAIYKLGWAYFNAPQTNEFQADKNYRKSISLFQEVIKQSGSKEKASSHNFNLREEAIRDLVMVWAEVDDTDAAWKYFSSIDEPEAFKKLLERLGNQYAEQGKTKEAIRIYRRLLKEDPKRKSNPELHLKLAELLDQSNDPDEVFQEVKAMQTLYLLTSEWTSANSDETKISARNVVEKSLHRFGTLFHQRGQKARMEVYLAAAANIYQLYLASFPSGPNAYEIRYYLAEIFYDQKKFEKSSYHYLKVAKQDPTGKYAKSAAYNAVGSLHEFDRLQTYEKIPSLGKAEKPIEIPRVKKNLLYTMREYLKIFPLEKEALPMRLETAKIYFDYGHYPLAIKKFEAITQENPKSLQAKNSVKTILEFFAQRQDWDKVISWSKSFSQRKDQFQDPSLQSFVDSLMQKAMFNQAIALEKEGKYEKAALSFLYYQRQFPNDKSADRAVYNASINYYKIGKIEDAISAGNLIRERYPTSKTIADVLVDLSATYESLAKFNEAAQLYEEFATKYPNDKRANSALYNSAILFKGQKKFDKSIALLHRVILSANDTKIRIDALTQLASLYEKNSNSTRAGQIYDQLAKEVEVDRDLRLYALAKSAVLKLGEGPKSAGELALSSIEQELSSHQNILAVKAREVIAASLFKRSEQEFVRFMESKSFDSLQIETQVKAKQTQLLSLSEKYEKIIGIKSGEYSVASLYRLGEAHEHFAQMLLSVAAPQGLSPLEVDQFKTELEKVAFPLKEEAYKFFETAYRRSSDVLTFTFWTKRSYQKMVELSPEKNPVVQEISADPSYLSHAISGDESFLDEALR